MRVLVQGTMVRTKPQNSLSCRMAFNSLTVLPLMDLYFPTLIPLKFRPQREYQSVNYSQSKPAPMSSITSTRTSSVLGSQRTQPRFQADLKPFNKRSAKSDHAHATPAKVRKLSQSETAPQRLSVDTRAKFLASSLKRQHENRFAGSKSLPPVSTV